MCNLYKQIADLFAQANLLKIADWQWRALVIFNYFNRKTFLESKWLAKAHSRSSQQITQIQPYRALFKVSLRW